MALPPFFPGGFMPTLRNNSDTLLAAGTGLLGGRTAPEQVAGLAQGVGAARQKNRTLEFLRQQNPDLAAAVESGALSGGDAYKLFYQQKLEAQKPKNQFMSAGGSLYNTETGQWVSPPAGAGNDAEYGLNPQYGVDPQGNPVLIQLSKGGTSKQTSLPEGVTLSKEPIKLDAGTEFILLDPITRQPVGRVPKDIAGAAAQDKIGAAAGAATAAAPLDLQAGQNAKQLVNDIRNDPSREWGTGKSSMLNSIPGTGGYDFQQKVEQAKSGAFSTAIQQLRGLGALSNTEGDTATKAVTRMNTALTEQGFLDALNDYEKIIDQGIARAQQKIQQSGGQVQAPPGVSATPAAPSGVRVYNPTTGKLE